MEIKELLRFKEIADRAKLKFDEAKKEFLEANPDFEKDVVDWYNVSVYNTRKNTLNWLTEKEMLQRFPDIQSKKIDYNLALNHPDAREFIKVDVNKAMRIAASKDKDDNFVLDF